MKLTTSRLITAITFVGVFAMATRVSADTDTWWHLRAGQWILEHRAVPLTDPFSHTRAGADWKYPGWLVEVPMYWLFANFSYAGLNLFTAVCVTLTFVFVHRSCEGHPFLKAFTLVLAAAASGVYWAARPHIVSFLLAGAFAYILHLYRWRGVNRLWALPPLMALWANAHGGFAIGFIFIALTLAGQALALVWRVLTAGRAQGEPSVPSAGHTGDVGLPGLAWLAGIGLACAVAVMLNPSGPAMLLYPFKTVSIGVLRDFIQEWQTPDFHRREAQPFLWLLFATLAAIGLSRRRVNLTDLLLVTGVAYLGFLAGRNVALLAIVAPPVVTRHVAAGWADIRERLPAWTAPSAEIADQRAIVVNWILLSVVTLAALLKVLIPLQPSVNEAEIARTLPVGAADYVRRVRPPGPLFNAYNFGAYLAWALYPDYPVYVDGRTDLYDDAFLREYLHISLGRPGYQAALDKYGVNLVIVESNSLLSDALTRDGWLAVYSDPVAAVYRRVTP
ncbi:MAG TPA: hypothetical protein VI793_14250 [Anaerolineales bacterium]|nr:hypothetical protein [Anaerolineales bacterium]